MAADEFEDRRRPSSQDSPGEKMPAKRSSAQVDNQAMGKKPSKPSKIKRMWTSLELDTQTVLTMAKAALPPTIAIALYQADAFANRYTTLGYLVAIASILGFAIMPRAKFLQTMLFNVLAVCIGVSVALFAIWTSVKARENTTPAAAAGTAAATGYNSSQSAVCAIWLFFQIYLVNTLKAKFPQLQFPAIIYSIFAIVSMSYAPEFPTMSAGISFATRLIEAFLTGFALTTGVSLFIFPLTSRTVVFKEMTGYIGALRGCLKAQSAYMRAMETKNIFQPEATVDREDDENKASDPGNEKIVPSASSEAMAVKKVVRGLSELHGKLHGDLPFGKREIAYGKLDAKDLLRMFSLLRSLLLPVIGLSSIIDMFEKVKQGASVTTTNHETTGKPLANEGERLNNEWHLMMKTLYQPFAEILGAIDDGLEHVLLVLELKPGRKKTKSTSDDSQDPTARDIEKGVERRRPGDRDFAQFLDAKTTEFYASREVTLQSWCEQKGIELPPDYLHHPNAVSFDFSNKMLQDVLHNKRQQLYMVLYMEHLLYSIGLAVQAFVQFADGKVEDGTMQSKKMIIPTPKRVRKWIASTFTVEDSSSGEHQGMNDMDSPLYSLQLGEAYGARKDPEHLPPKNRRERIGDHIRRIPRFLRSPESVFGFRVACATMSLAIVSYLQNTQQFFMKQRLFWAMIMVAISMTRTSGQSTFNFILRVSGTVIAMVASLVIWYIVDGRAPGVIVFLWVWCACGFWVVLKRPAFTVVGILSVVTTVLIIGYELQVQKIGIAASETNGQPYYPIYELAPYRLACVVGGILVAFIWTIFPYPISERSELRQELGRSLYLLANFYSIVHETVKARIRGDEGSPLDPNCPRGKLENARFKVFSKLVFALTTLRTYSSFAKWQASVGGKFPKEHHDTIIECISRILNYIALIGYASSTFVEAGDNSQTAWLTDFRKLLRQTDPTSHEITSMLCLLSSSVSSGQPLPPYLKAPQPYGLSKKLETLDRDILSVRHIAEPGYAAFAVMQVCSRAICNDIELLLKTVKTLVGELDFSYHIVSTASGFSSSDETLLHEDGEKGKTD